MNKKILSIVIALLLSTVSLSIIMPAGSSILDNQESTFAGTGTVADPYIITNLVELQNMKNNVSANYTLANDIDASDTSTWGSGGWDPIGDWLSTFNGTFDGAGFTVTGLTIDRSVYSFQGFFGVASASATIKNITLSEVSIIGGGNTGGLAGRSYASLSNCHVEGDVSGGMNTGGLVGQAGGSIDNCSTNVSTSSTHTNSGGLVGHGIGLDMNGCSAFGNVQCNQYAAGGAIGYLSSGLVMNSFAVGDLQATDEQLGGFIGYNGGTIKQCYATGDIPSSYSWNGGFVGRNHGTVEDSYATGNVTCSDRAGGFCSYNVGTIRTSYSIGTPSGANASGFVSDIPGTVTDSYWDTGASGVSTSSYGIPKNTPQMLTQSTFANWNFTSVWAMKEGETRPYLQGLHQEPMITPANILLAQEDQLYSVNYNTVGGDYLNYPVANTMTWQGETNATWLNFNNVTGLLSGTPTNDDPGTYWVNISLDLYCGHADTFTNFTLAVDNVNDDPVIETADVTSTPEDMTYSVDYDATDIDPTNDVLLWTLATNATWLSMVNTTGILSGTPGNDDVGDYFVEVNVSDGLGGFDISNFTLTVDNVQDPPFIHDATVPDGMVGDAYVLDMDATDIDGDVLEWTLETNATWLSINSTSGLLWGVPDASGTFWANVTVDDNDQGTDIVNLTILIKPDSDAPVVIDPVENDTDGDGTPDTTDTDNDNDGWSDAEEILAGTDPLDDTDEPADADGDGIADFMDEDSFTSGTGTNETASNIETVTPSWAYGALIAAIILGILVLLLLLRGGGKSQPATNEVEESAPLEAPAPAPAPAAAPVMPLRSPTPKPKPTPKLAEQSKSKNLSNNDKIARLKKAYDSGKISEEQYLTNMKKFQK